MKMKAANKKTPKKSKKLSDREILVLILICKEFLASQAAKRLGISVKTFNNHRFNLRWKTSAKTNIGLYKYALRKGYIKL